MGRILIGPTPDYESIRKLRRNFSDYFNGAKHFIYPHQSLGLITSYQLAKFSSQWATDLNTVHRFI